MMTVVGKLTNSLASGQGSLNPQFGSLSRFVMLPDPALEEPVQPFGVPKCRKERAHVGLHDPLAGGADATQTPDQVITGRCRGDQEVEAESVAYLVATVHGIDTADYAFDYLAGWASSKGEDLVGVTHEVGARVVRIAHDIRDRVGSSDTADDGGRRRELQVPSAKKMSIDGAPASRVGNQVHAPSIRWHRFTEDDGELGL
jgi:hypothetical protein